MAIYLKKKKKILLHNLFPPYSPTKRRSTWEFPGSEKYLTPGATR